MIKMNEKLGTIEVDGFVISPNTKIKDFMTIKEKVTINKYKNKTAVTINDLQTHNGVKAELTCIYQPHYPMRVKISTRFTGVPGEIYSKKYAKNSMQLARKWLKGLVSYTDQDFDKKMNLRFGEYGTIECIYYYCFQNDLYSYDDITIEMWKKKPLDIEYNIMR